jgi:dTDP-4-amino-4,6-dideoxygalactose transaminase
MGHKVWPLGKVPIELQRPELEQVKELGYRWKDPFDVVDMFEREVSKFAGCKYGIAVDNCTDGLFLALKYVDYKGTITIPCRNYCSPPMSIIQAGCKIKFEDIEWSGVYQLKPTNVYDGATRWTEGMFEAKDGYQVVSFQIKKRIPIGKGGMILTNDKKAYEWFKMMRYEGRNTDVPYVKDILQGIGYNMYMLPEDAARGLILMNKIPRQNDDTGGSDNYTDLREQRIFDDFLENS